MRIAVVGSSGYIAEFLLEQFAKEKNIEYVLKIDQDEAADAFLNLQEPYRFGYSLLDDIDFVVFTAAVSSPDKCAEDNDFCWDINVTGTSHFIHEAINRKCKVIFFSSDAVFGNIPGKIYTEQSATQAQTPYGKMKKTVEDEFKLISNFKTIRLSYVVSVKDRFVSYCLGCMQQDKIAEVFHPFYRNCIVVSDVVKAVIWLLWNWNKYEPFALNLAGNELISRVRIADELNQIFNNRLRYIICEPSDGFYKNRPQNTQMKSIYIQKYNILENCTFTEKIREEILGYI